MLSFAVCVCHVQPDGFWRLSFPEYWELLTRIQPNLKDEGSMEWADDLLDLLERFPDADEAR